MDITIPEYIFDYMLSLALYVVGFVAISLVARWYLERLVMKAQLVVLNQTTGLLSSAVRAFDLPSHTIVHFDMLPLADKWKFIFRASGAYIVAEVKKVPPLPLILRVYGVARWLIQGFNLYLVMSLIVVAVKVTMWSYKRIKRHQAMVRAAAVIGKRTEDGESLDIEDMREIRESFISLDIRHPVINPKGEWEPPKWALDLLADKPEVLKGVRPWWEMYFEFVSMLSILVAAVAALGGGPAYKLLTVVTKKLAAVNILKSWLTLWYSWVFEEEVKKPPVMTNWQKPEAEPEPPAKAPTPKSDEEEPIVDDSVNSENLVEFWGLLLNLDMGRQSITAEFPRWLKPIHDAYKDPVQWAFMAHWVKFMLARKNAFKSVPADVLVDILLKLTSLPGNPGTEELDKIVFDLVTAGGVGTYVIDEKHVSSGSVTELGGLIVFVVLMVLFYWACVYLFSLLLVKLIQWVSGTKEKKYRVVAVGSPAYEELVKKYPLADIQIRDNNGFVPGVATFDVTEAKGGSRKRDYRRSGAQFDDEGDTRAERSRRDARIENDKIPQTDYQDFVSFVQGALNRAKGDDKLVAAIEERRRSGIRDAKGASRPREELEAAKSAIEMLILNSKRKAAQKVEDKIDKPEAKSSGDEKPKKKDKVESHNPRNPPIYGDVNMAQKCGVFVVTQKATNAAAHGIMLGAQFYVPRHVLDDFRKDGKELTVQVGKTIPGRPDFKIPLDSFVVPNEKVDYAYATHETVSKACSAAKCAIPASASVRPWDPTTRCVGVLWHTSAIRKKDRERFGLPESAWVATSSQWMEGVADVDEHQDLLKAQGLVGIVHYNSTYEGVSGAPILAYLDNRWVVSGFHVGTAVRHDGQQAICFLTKGASKGAGGSQPALSDA